MVDDCAGHERARIRRPPVVFVEADFLRRRPVDDRPLPQITRRLEFSYRYWGSDAFGGRRIGRGRQIERIARMNPLHIAIRATIGSASTPISSIW
jgi:hypothetical protein